MKDFLEALREGDADAGRAYLRDDPGLAHPAADDVPPIHRACDRAAPEVVKALLEFGADPNAATEDGETALHIAAFAGCDECVQPLLDAGANVEARTELGKTPLMNAAQAGPSTVKLLLAAGADPKARRWHGNAALHWAAMGQHDDPG